MKRCRKRTLLTVLMLLTGGAIINVAVAILLAFSWPNGLIVGTGATLPLRDNGETRHQSPEFLVAVRRHFGVVNIFACTGEAHRQCQFDVGDPTSPVSIPIKPVDEQLPGWSIAAAESPSAISTSPFASFSESGFGWPFVATFSRVDMDWGSTRQNTGSITVAWPNFAINTIFYAAILWLLFAAPGIVRRRIRARRGQCPACAYPVGASSVCTECGRPLKTHKAQTHKAQIL